MQSVLNSSKVGNILIDSGTLKCLSELTTGFARERKRLEKYLFLPSHIFPTTVGLFHIHLPHITVYFSKTTITLKDSTNSRKQQH